MTTITKTFLLVLPLCIIGCAGLLEDSKEAAIIAAEGTVQDPAIQEAITAAVVKAVEGDSVREDASELGTGAAAGFLLRFLPELLAARRRRRKGVELREVPIEQTS